MKLPDWNPPTPAEAALLPGMNDGAIALRPWTLADGHAHFEAAFASRREVGVWLPWCHRDYSAPESLAFIASCPSAWSKGEDFAFAIVRFDDGRVLGGCSLNEIRRIHRLANLGFWVRPDETGRGVASTATRLLARFGFVHLGLQRVEIVAAVGNFASQGAARRAGATRESVLRNRLHIHGTSHDAVMYSLIPADLGL